MKCKIQTTIYKRNGKKKKTKYSMGHIQKKKLDEMNKWGNVCAEANITLNLYCHPEPNEPHTHMHTHTYRQGIVRSKEKKWEKKRENLNSIWPTPRDTPPKRPHTPQHWAMQFRLSKWNAQVCTEFWFRRQSTNHPPSQVLARVPADVAPASLSRFRSSCRSLANQFNVSHFAAKWGIFEISSKIRCVPSDKARQQPTPPTPKPQPKRTQLGTYAARGNWLHWGTFFYWGLLYVPLLVESGEWAWGTG